jgi:hypothetical protein
MTMVLIGGVGTGGTCSGATGVVVDIISGVADIGQSIVTDHELIACKCRWRRRAG